MFTVALSHDHSLTEHPFANHYYHHYQPKNTGAHHLSSSSGGGAITDSYWNTDIFGAGTDGVGRTTAQLQSPTGYTGIYRDWNADLDNADRNDDDATGADDFWDFGISSQYPALKADIDGDGTPTWQEFGRQRMNTPPEFPDAETERSVPENLAEDENIGGPVVAQDAEDDTLTYALGGVDAASFDIVASSGQLQTKAALDFETKSSYTVTVSVDDGQDADWNAYTTSDATVTVTITVTDVDETPEVTGEAAVDYQENGVGAVAAYTATEPDNDPITWSLSGPDMGAFDIGSGGELAFNTPPDFEGPADADTDNVYEVTVEASDGGATPGTLDVTVTVANVDETPEVTGEAAVHYQENGAGAVAAYTATEPDKDPITWSLSGPDGCLRHWQRRRAHLQYAARLRGPDGRRHGQRVRGNGGSLRRRSHPRHAGRHRHRHRRGRARSGNAIVTESSAWGPSNGHP